MLTITRKNLLLTISDNVIPAMGSSDVPVKFVNDTETYAGFLIEPRVGYYINGCPKSGICEYDTSSNIIKIPAEAFKNKGILVIAIALIDNADSNHIEVTKELALEVTPAPNGTVILPATETWQTAVSNLVEQLYNQDYKSQFDQIEEDLSGLVEEAENQQTKAKEQQTQIDNAIDIMGDYEIVQDNPTQIRFKKGDGTYGDTVNLGDNLASKSMVNAGYDTYSGNSYSGPSSDYGIEIGKASGNYEQVTTNGYQLFDQRQFPTKTNGGATITNNGDGSLTISGSGNLTNNGTQLKMYTHKETVKLLKVGKLKLKKFDVDVFPRLEIGIYNGVSWVKKITGGLTDKELDITSSDLETTANVLMVRFEGASGQPIKSGTIKPMLYQDGDGTWEEFTGGEPGPNPNYPLEPKFFEPKHVNTNGYQLFDQRQFPTKTNGGATITNNGDGSLTISGSGNLTNNGTQLKMYTHKETVKLLKVGKLKLKKFDVDVFPRLEIGIYNGVSWVKKITGGLTDKELDITSSDLETTANVLMVRFEGASGQPIKSGTIKPMLYQDGDGTWLPYNADSTPLDITLRALPNGVCDTYENGVITRRVGIYIVDTIGSLQTITSSGRKFFVLNTGNKKYQDGMISFLCNKIQKTEAETQDDCIYQNSINFVIVGTADDTLETFKEKFLNTIVYYELAEPTIEQVDLPIIPSYFPYTNAWHDSEVEASELTWNILARQYGSGQTTIKKDEAVLTELDLNTERTVSPTTVKVQLQDSEGKVLYLETSSENIYIQSGRFSGKTVQQVLENSIQAISATDEYIEVDVPDSMTQSIDEEFLVDEVDESETETE